MNQAKGEHSYENNDGWRTPDNSWLELEAEDEIRHAYHVNIIMEEDDSIEERTELSTEKAGNDEENQFAEEKGNRMGKEAVQLLAKKRRLKREGVKVKMRRVKQKKTRVEGKVDWEKLK